MKLSKNWGKLVLPSLHVGIQLSIAVVTAILPETLKMLPNGGFISRLGILDHRLESDHLFSPILPRCLFHVLQRREVVVQAMKPLRSPHELGRAPSSGEVRPEAVVHHGLRLIESNSIWDWDVALLWGRSWVTSSVGGPTLRKLSSALTGGLRSQSREDVLELEPGRAEAGLQKLHLRTSCFSLQSCCQEECIDRVAVRHLLCHHLFSFASFPFLLVGLSGVVGRQKVRLLHAGRQLVERDHQVLRYGCWEARSLADL
mmetsp:Transcript_55645/g.118507  ORF Transcript_55645/g.118507 Transcript_55645/m.118507 type:complete len:258 (+) Transcript_55645:784-1557(+)